MDISFYRGELLTTKRDDGYVGLGSFNLLIIFNRFEYLKTSEKNRIHVLCIGLLL